MSNRFSTFDNRLVYQQGLQVIQAAGLSASTVKLTQSVLRLEQQLSITTARYQFSALKVDNGPSGTQFNTEVRLNQQDSFVVSSMGMYIGEPSSATDTTWIDHTYPNPLTFVGTGEAVALETLYKSQLRMTINNIVVMPTLYTSRFRKVGAAQKVTAAANQNGIGNDQIDMSSDGLMLVEPNIYIIGSKQNLIELILPVALSAVSASGFTRVILELRGLLAQNSTSVT